jgi:hypothetical protein
MGGQPIPHKTGGFPKIRQARAPPHRAASTASIIAWFPEHKLRFPPSASFKNVLNAVTQLPFLGSGNVRPQAWWAGTHLNCPHAHPLVVEVVLSLWFIAPIGPDLHIAM